MMMDALFELQVGNIDCAIAIVANAFSLFESEMISLNRDGQCEYLPGLLFLVGLCCVINDHVALHEHIPTLLSPAFSRVISTSFEPMRAHCLRVLNETNNATSDLQEEQTCHNNNKTEIIAEWADLVSTASLRGRVAQEQPQRESSIVPWCASSVTLLGVGYHFGLGGVDKDINKAVTLYQRAADAGDATATWRLGWCFYCGLGVDKDIHKAATLWQRAADAGDVKGMSNLAVCYYYGYGVEKYIHEALRLWQRAADSGSTQAMFNLALYYQKGGDGPAKDIREAMRMWLRAANLGHTDAGAKLKILHSKCGE
ncbi:calmodulin-dependent protein kinase [Pelomyxa schiedti]|nr:calmodulin-dependent protein kinase [Pelomyxa schiedti]